MRDQNTHKIDQEKCDAMTNGKKRRKKNRLRNTILAWFFALCIFIIVVLIVIAIVMTIGEKSLRDKAQSSGPNMVVEENSAATSSESSAVWQEGWVRHDGKIYAYNDDIMTFLVMGIDKEDEVTESTSATDGGQADAMFLVIVNPHEKDIKILAINRDTMTDIQMVGMGPDGTTAIGYGQITVQHGFGDGKEQSCELTRDAVSALLYDLPIHGYVAVSMDAIPIINDAVGGVEVTVLEDLTWVSKKLKQGEQITLKGMDAYNYVRFRDTGVFESARGRLARQQQYLSAFAAKLKEATKNDITVPVKLYQELSEYMVTDVTVDEVAYLAGQLLDYSFGGDNVYTMEGETVQGETYEEFYPDADALKELMLELFYEEVEQ